jgi:hypothetical protein
MAVPSIRNVLNLVPVNNNSDGGWKWVLTIQDIVISSSFVIQSMYAGLYNCRGYWMMMGTPLENSGTARFKRSKIFRWAKLELVRNRSPLEELEGLRELMDGLSEVNKLHENANGPTDVPRHVSKTTENIFEFYLGHVAREWNSYITAQGIYILDGVPVDIVATHPAV